MDQIDQQDMFVIRMGIEMLLECMRQVEAWWGEAGDNVTLRRTQQLANTIARTRSKFSPNDRAPGIDVSQALVVAEGLRGAASQCNVTQAALQARLIGGADTIELLCRTRGRKP